MTRSSWIVLCVASVGGIAVAAAPMWNQAAGAGNQQKQAEDPPKQKQGPPTDAVKKQGTPADAAKKQVQHPLAIAKTLGLSDEQAAAIKQIWAAHEAKVVALKQQQASTDKAVASDAIHKQQAETMAAVLKVLTPDQRAKYDQAVVAAKQEAGSDATKKDVAPKDAAKKPGADNPKKDVAPKDAAKKPGADSPKKDGAPKDAAKKPVAGPFAILGDLGLSEDQAAKAKAIIAGAMQKVHDLKASNPNADKASLAPQIEAIKLEAMKSIRSILTPEQQARFDKAAGGDRKRDKKIGGPKAP
jgi:Spy/CpxP family protein refolding chaperone